MRERQLETARDMSRHQPTGTGRILLFQRLKNRAMRLIRFLHAFLVMPKPFYAKDARVDVTIARKFGESGIACGLNDGHVEREVGL